MPSIPEIIGFIFGIAGVWLTIKEHWTCFPTGLISVSVSLVLFLDQKLYSNSLLQGVYIILLCYGWYRWKYPVVTERPEISYASAEMRWYLALIGLVTAAGLGWLFSNYSDAKVPYIDASATSLCFAAQYLIAKKKIENWWLWIVANPVYIGIYLSDGLYLYALLFLVYLVLAIQGLVTWKKSLADKNLAAL